jgi:hypothetical protein
VWFGFWLIGIMSESSIIMAAKRQPSFFSIAAWMSLIVPLATLAITTAISSLSGHTSFLPPPSRHFSGDLNGWAMLIDFVGLILGVFSLFGVRKHGAALILWKALPGVFLSGVLGFYHFALVMASSIICWVPNHRLGVDSLWVGVSLHRQGVGMQLIQGWKQ